jgi:hypothetical protein
MVNCGFHASLTTPEFVSIIKDEYGIGVNGSVPDCMAFFPDILQLVQEKAQGPE